MNALPALVYRAVGEEGFATVEPLWVKLRAHHSQLPWHFRHAMPPFAFEPRRQEILAKAAPGKLCIELVSNAADGVDVGYCISTVSESGRGEVDSMFVEESFRGRGIGGELFRHALAWLESMGASSKVVTVAYGNEAALALYQRFGFHPRNIVLEQGDDSAT